jgi:hypothetical protein
LSVKVWVAGCERRNSARQIDSAGQGQRRRIDKCGQRFPLFWHQDFRHREQHERSPDILLHSNVLGAFDHVHRDGIIRLSSVEGVLYGKLEPLKVTLKRNPRCQLLLKDLLELQYLSVGQQELLLNLRITPPRHSSG